MLGNSGTAGSADLLGNGGGEERFPQEQVVLAIGDRLRLVLNGDGPRSLQDRDGDPSLPDRPEADPGRRAGCRSGTL